MIDRALIATGLCYSHHGSVRINTAMVAIVIGSSLALMVLV